MVLENFAHSDFGCRCGCGKNNVDMKLKVMLDTACNIARIPFIIVTGSTCNEVGESIYLSGKAVRIKINNPVEMYTVVSSLLQAGFNRIGMSDDFVHVDIDNTKTPHSMWIY